MSLLSSMFIGEHGAAQKPAGTGTVASVGLTAAVALFAITGSPVTGSGTIDLALKTQAANQILAGPTTGAAASPTFRTLVSDDIPALDAIKIASGILSTARLGTGTANSTTFLRGDGVWAIPGGAGTVTSVDMTVPSILSVSGGPITASGTLAITLSTQSANVVFAGPTTGAATVPTFRSIVAADLGTGTANSSTFLRGDGTWAVPGGGGTVTSVGLSLPSIFSVTGSPVTGSGTLSATLANQTANLVFAGPSSGGAAAPTFRSIVAADLGTGTANSSTFLRGDLTWATPSAAPGGSTTQVQFNDAGAFNGDSLFVWNNTEKVLTLSSASTTLATLSITKTGNNNIGALSVSSSSTSANQSTISISNTGSGFAMIVTNASGSTPAIRVLSNANKTSSGAIELGCYAGVAGTHQDALYMYSSVSGSGTAGTSIGIKFSLESSTAVEQDAGRFAVAWSVATHASRSSYISLQTVESAGALTERIRIGRTVAVGTTTTLNDSYMLNVVNSSTTSYHAAIRGQATGAATTVGIWGESSQGPGGVVLNTHTNASHALEIQGSSSVITTPLIYALRNSSITNQVQPMLSLRVWSTGTAATGNGGSIEWKFESSTTTDRDAAQLAVAWSDATDATRSAYMAFATVHSAGALTERMRLTSDGVLRVGTTSIYFGLRPAGSGTPVWTLPSADGTINQVLYTDGSGNLGWMTVGGSGTVTSVALAAPSEFNVTGTPVTTTGTLTLAWANVSSNLVFAGPATGAATTPAFRALVADDIPVLDAAKITTGTIATARLGSGTADATTFLRGDQTWATPTVTAVNDSTFRIQDNGDTSKQIAFEASSIATATTRTITVPNRNITLDQLTVGTTVVSGGSANRLLQQDTSGNFSYQANLSYFATRFGFRHDGNVASSGIMDVTVTGTDPTLYVRNYVSSYAATTPILYARVDSSAATSVTHDVLVLAADSNGTATAGFGVRMLMRAESSTSSMQEQAALASSWSTATHASRTSRFSVSLVDNASSLTEVLRVDGPGNLTSWISTASTSSLVEAQRISLATSGTPATGLGVSQVFALESSTTANTDAGFMFVRWTDPTHASFQAMFGICVYEGTGLSGSSTAPNFAVSGGGTWTQNMKSATTNAVVTAWTRAIDSTGTAAANFGLRDLIQLDTNATPGVSAAAFDTTWIDAITASATSQWTIYLADAGTLTERYRFLNGGIDIRNSSGRLYINGTQVVTTRQPGWSAATGAKTRSSFDASTVTTPQLGERVGALIDDLMTHGLI